MFQDKGLAEPDQSRCSSKNTFSLETTLTNSVLEGVLNKLQKKDTYGMFAEPVDSKEVPDYYDYIKNPMDFSTMRKKISEGAYISLEMFENDLLLICSNAMSYNAKDTLYYRKARSIQDAALKILEALKAGLPFDTGTKYQPSPVKKMSCKRPYSLKSWFEQAGSDYSSGVSLASEAVKSGKVLLDKSGWSSFHSLDGRDFQDTISGFSLNSMSIREGKKVQSCEENRSTYILPEPFCGITPVLAAFGGELQQLFPVGYSQDFTYARSLSRFAADLGPAIWKVAAEKIRKSLPPNAPFGPGWVLEPPPNILPVLTRGQSTLVRSTEPKLLLRSLPNSKAGNLMQGTREAVSASASSLSTQSSQAGFQSVQADWSKHHQPARNPSEEPLTTNVIHSMLPETAQSNRVTSWNAGRQMEQTATLSQSCDSTASHRGNSKFETNPLEQGHDVSKESRFAPQHERNKDFLIKRSSILPVTPPSIDPFSSSCIASTTTRGVSSIISGPYGQSKSIKSQSLIDKSQLTAGIQVSENVFSHPGVQALPASAQQGNPTSTLTQRQLSCDAPSHTEQQFMQMNQQGPIKLGALPGNKSSSGLQISNFVQPSECMSLLPDLSLTKINSSMRSFNGSQDLSPNSPHAPPPDLNVSLATLNSYGHVSSNSVSDSQQPDLALQL